MVFYQLIFGETPWIGKSPVQLLMNIKNQPLKFSENIPCSDLVKDLLRKMLVYEEDKRIN